MSTALLSAVLNNVHSSKIRYTHDLLPPPGTILLVSGSFSFIKSWSLQISNHVLIWVTSTFDSVKIPLMVTYVGIFSGMKPLEESLISKH
jgi:hypothetical protein